MKEISLKSKDKDEFRSLRDWAVTKNGDNQLVLTTEHPASAWIFELNPDNILISATSAGLYLTAKAPAPAGRVVARLLDPEGVPVNWRGTDEITNSWNGKDTQNPSHLSSRNPEVMTFALGQVDGGNLHSLFDREQGYCNRFS